MYVVSCTDRKCEILVIISFTPSLLFSHSVCTHTRADPINIFFGMYKTDNAPIRLSYHYGVHYNSVVDPYSATVGVGLGLAGHKPGVSQTTHRRWYF